MNRSRALNDLRLARLRLTRAIPENMPLIVRTSIEACPKVVTQPEDFPELGGGHGQTRFKFCASGRERDLRRREAIALVWMALLYHCNLIDLRNGKRRRDGSCDSPRVARPRPREGRDVVDRGTYETLEKLTGLSRSTLFAALRDGRDAGYWESSQEVKKWIDDDGFERHRGMPAVYQLTKLGFKRLGIEVTDPEAGIKEGWLEREMSLAGARARAKPAPEGEDVFARRQRQRVIRVTQRLAAKTARLQREFEEKGEGRLERIHRLEQTRKRRE